MTAKRTVLLAAESTVADGCRGRPRLGVRQSNDHTCLHGRLLLIPAGFVQAKVFQVRAVGYLVSSPKYPLFAGVVATVLAFRQSSAPAMAPTGPVAATAPALTVQEVAENTPSGRAQPATPASTTKPMTVLMRTGNWFIYSHGCDTVKERRNVIIHFHGAHTTVIPRYLASGLDAVLVIINLGLFSGPYTNAYALRANVDGLLERIKLGIAEQCGLADASITRLALSSWSAGYGATEQFLRWRPERVDAVLLADGLHVGFTDRQARAVNLNSLEVFVRFAQQATRGDKLMYITHSSIIPAEYAGAAETAMAVSQAAHVPTWTVNAEKYGMQQVTAARRGDFYVEGFAGNDKPAHAQHLYSIGKTSFARLREYWER
jgi:hypothetical protein